MTVHLLNPYVLNPRTGERLRGLFIVNTTGRATYVPPVMGGAPDDGDGGNGDSGTGDGSGGAGSGDGTGEGSTGTEGETGTEGDGDKPISREEFNKVLARMQAADKRASSAEDKLKQAERAKMDESERTKAELQDAKKENEALKDQLRQTKLENAWLAVDGVTWHDPDAAMSIADRKGVLAECMDADGKVDTKKLRSAVDKFAKEHQYLVKTDSTGNGGGAPPGDSVGSKHKSKDNGTPDEEAVRKRYGRLIR
jgi:hypothetical protein